MSKEEKSDSDEKDTSFRLECFYRHNPKFTMTDFPEEIVDIESDRALMTECMAEGTTKRQQIPLKAPQPENDIDILPNSDGSYIRTTSEEGAAPQTNITAEGGNHLSPQSVVGSKFTLQEAPISYIQPRNAVIEKTRSKLGLESSEMAPDTYFLQIPSDTFNENNCNNKITDDELLDNEVSRNVQNEPEQLAQINTGMISPGAYAIIGFGADDNDDTEEDVDSQRENLESNQAPEILIVADVVDNDADKAKIIDAFIAGTTQASIVETKKPFFRRRNVLFGVLGILVFCITLIVVLPLTLSESKKEKLLKVLQPISGKEALLRTDSFQNEAFQWLLKDEWYSLNNGLDDKHARERYIAALFYFSTGGSFWEEQFDFLNNQKSVCAWNNGNVTGIQCNAEQMVTSIFTVHNNLTGILPSELSNLEFLESISVSHNKLNGTISSNFGNLRRLKEFELSSNSFTGTIPSEINNVRSLQALKMSDNKLTGTIHPDFTDLTSLEVIDLEDNLLSGGLPDKFNRISRLNQILLRSNKLTGTIPESLQMLGSTLESLHIGFNNLNAKIPSNIGSCSRLTSLHLESSSLTGTLPKGLGSLNVLQVMNLKNNKLTGTIPKDFDNLWRMVTLDLSINKLTGEIPAELSYLRTLGTLRLNENEFTGIIPPELSSAENLAILAVYNNNLVGTVSKNLCRKGIEIQADCWELDCDCCLCFRDGSDIIQGAHSCDGNAKKLIEDNLIKGKRGEVDCRCLSTDGLHVGCDESCITCNIDETICVKNVQFQTWMNHRNSVMPDKYSNRVDYIRGRNESIEWGSGGWEDNEIDTCWARINGVECNSCFVKKCTNGKNAPFISCDNIEGVGDFDGCDATQSENAGVFSAILWSISRSLVKDAYCPVLDAFNIWDNFF